MFQQLLHAETFLFKAHLKQPFIAKLMVANVFIYGRLAIFLSFSVVVNFQIQ